MKGFYLDYGREGKFMKQKVLKCWTWPWSFSLVI